MLRRNLLRNEKDISGCAIAGLMSRTRRLIPGEYIIRSMSNMNERGNGLGGGFAAYGIYPDYKDLYAFHFMFDTEDDRSTVSDYLRERCHIHHHEPIPIREDAVIGAHPIIERFFLSIRPEYLQRHPDWTEEDAVVTLVMRINSRIDGAFVVSSGKNMGVFKGVGYPEDIAGFYRLEEYEAYTWIGHARFPTNTTGWWGGAHPFGLLDWAVVHNGEISSYGINRRYLANFGYECSMQTDTEVITYIFDLLMRKHNLPLDLACMAMAPPFWSKIRRMSATEQKRARAVRLVYGGALLNGPFSVLVGHSGGMIGFNDRVKLRPMCAANKDDMLYIASEEAAIRVICPEPESVWQAEGGVPIVGSFEEESVEAVAHSA